MGSVPIAFDARRTDPTAFKEVIEMIKENPKWFKILVRINIILIICIIFSMYFLSISRVSGISMKPTFHDNDIIITLRYPGLFKRQPKRNSIITFHSPFNPKYSFAKRVIGLPGDHIRIESGKVYVNDEELIEDYTEEGTKTWTYRYSEWTVPEDHVFVLGDNRQVGGSSDSRSYGFIPQANITNYVVFIIYPYSDRWGFINSGK